MLPPGSDKTFEATIRRAFHALELFDLADRRVKRHALIMAYCSSAAGTCGGARSGLTLCSSVKVLLIDSSRRTQQYLWHTMLA